MKKIISLLLIAALTVTSMVCAYASDFGPQLLNVNDVEQYNFSDEMTQMIKTQIENGGQVYYGQGTTTPDYLDENINSRAIPTEIVNLPSSGAVFDYDMEYGNVYYSPYLFKATSSCRMKIYRTCTVNNDPCNINLQIVDKTTDRVVFDEDLYVNEDGYTMSYSLTASHQYYLITTPLDSGESHVSFYVYGQ